MKIKVTLDNGGGELDAKLFEITEGCSDEQDAVNTRIHEILAKWTLSEGDTINIREVA